MSSDELVPVPKHYRTKVCQWCRTRFKGPRVQKFCNRNCRDQMYAARNDRMPKLTFGLTRLELRKLCRTLGGVAGNELFRRLTEPDALKDMSLEELQGLMTAALKLGIGTPQQVKLTGSGPGGAIAVAVVGPQARAKEDE